MFTATVDLESTTCCACGVEFAMPRNMLEKRRANKESFYCPNGHSLSFTESKVAKLERQLQQERQRLDQARADAAFQKECREAAEKDAARAKKATKRLKTRAAGGVCPCCNRHFPDLHSHMSVKHPEVVKDAGVSLAMPRKRT